MKTSSRLSSWLLVTAALAPGAAGLTVVTVAAGPAGTAAAAPAPETFAGYWHVHGSQLLIDPTSAHPVAADWYGVEVVSDGGAVTVLFSLTLSASGTRMKAQVEGVGFTNQSGKSAPLADPGQNLAAGDSFVLTFVHPYLMKMVDIHTAHPVIGNPYWCGVGIAQQYVHFCGA